MSKQHLEERFSQLIQTKENSLLNQTRVFQELVLFMQHKIRDHFKSFSLFNLCGSQRSKFMVDPHLEKAFTDLSIQEQLQLYEKTISFASNIQNLSNESEVDINFEEESENNNDRKQAKRFKVDLEQGFYSWKQIFLTIQGFKVTSTDLQFDIRNYLLRKSKKKDKECYVLEAIHQSKPQIIRFCFLTNSDIKKYLPIIKELIDIGYKEEIKRMYEIENPKSAKIKKKTPKKIKAQKPSTQDSAREHKTQSMATGNLPRLTLQPLDQDEEEGPNQLKNQSHFVKQIIKYPEQQDISMELNQFVANQNEKYNEERQKQKASRTTRSYKNIFSIIFPCFNLAQLEQFQGFRVATSNEQLGCFAFQHIKNTNLFKLQIFLKLSPEVTILALTNTNLYQIWHPEIVQSQIKLSISSQNSAIVYQKHKKYSQWYRQRDFVFLRHVFKLGDDYYVADKSIQNINFIPFSTIHRGSINHQIAKVSSSPSGSKLVISLDIEHGGLLNRQYAQELTTRYLLGFQKIEGFFLKKDYQDKLKPYFNTEWKVKLISFDSSTSFYQKDKAPNESVQFQSDAMSQIQNSDVFFSIKDQNEQNNVSVHEVQEEDLPIVKPVTIQGEEEINLDEEGFVVLPKQYLKVRHPTNTVDPPHDKRYQKQFQNIMLRNDWNIMNEGGLVLYNKKVIADQDSVLSFMMNTFKKNLFSKGPLNISLPVTVFNCRSQISQYAQAFARSPVFLEQAAKLSDPIERMKRVMLAGLSNSLLFFDITKAFNPILGETYQSYIDGCPFYGEQISHHPPVTSILFMGRGYKVYASLEATVHIHMNSADGLNLGWYHVLFDDGQEICFQTPPAEFSGFAIGDRKFNFKQKGYYFDQNNNLYAQMSFEDQSGLFSGNKWKHKDQVQAQILTVKNQFLNKFIGQFLQKKHKPSNKDILDRHGKLQGRWPFEVHFQNGPTYSANQDLPCLQIPYQYPLNSNTNYREDLYYRKNQDFSKSQSQKQRLQNVQRSDRKFRAKYGKQ